MPRWLVALAVVLVVLVVCPVAEAQEPPKKPGKAWGQEVRSRFVYERAMEHTLRRLKKRGEDEEGDDDDEEEEEEDPDEVEDEDSFAPSYAAKMVMGWLVLADGSQPEATAKVLKLAANWKKHLGDNELTNHRWNWYPALAGTLIAEQHKLRPTRETQDQLKAIVAHFIKYQETTGGWFKSYEGAIKRAYPVKDLGFLDAMIYGFLRTVKAQGIDVPPAVLERAGECLNKITTGGGVSYGTGQKGPDKTGARGAFAMRGLMFAGDKGHRLVKLYAGLLPRNIPNMDQGHHIGAFHCLGVTLGCHALGRKAYKKLTDHWLEKLMAKQKDDGGIYVGDDKADGGEEGLIGADDGSTAAAALLILLRNPTLLQPNKVPTRNWLSVLPPLPTSKKLTSAAKLALAGKLDKALSAAARVGGNKRAKDVEKAEAKAIEAACVAHAAAVLKRAEAALEAQEIALAKAMLTPLAKTLKKHEHGKSAQALLSKIKKDATIKKQVAANKALAKAWATHFKQGMAKARPLFEKVVADHAGTAAAENAQAMLK